MKKMMIVLAAIAMAMGVQAASVSWKLQQNNAPYKSGSWMVYAFAGDVTASAITALSSTDSAVWAGFLGGDSSTKLTAARGQASGVANGFTKGETSYLTFVLVDTAIAEGNTWQVLSAANVTDNVYEGTDVPTAFSTSITSNIAQSGTFTAQSVPEPTSALMLLLGMAGLALKRKVA